MKKIEGYQCGNCETIHPTEDECRACENGHSERMAGAKITGWTFDSTKGKYGFEIAMAKNVPPSIFVKFSDGHGDFAVYVLKRYGFKGV